MPKTSKTDREEAIARLRQWLKPGDYVHTTTRHVSRSGMQRVISLLFLRPNPDWENGVQVLHISYNASKTHDRERDGIKVHGCGMDMGFHTVYELSGALFGDGYALKHKWL